MPDNSRPIETRKDEIRFRTSDVSRMRNFFTASRVIRRFKEEMFDENTGEKIQIDRTDLLFEKGTLLDDNAISQILFWQQEGTLDGVEIECTNQRRLSFVQRNNCLYPYKATAKIGDKKQTFLLYATSVANALEIVTDYIELNFTGGFTVSEVKEMDYFIILIDSMRTPRKDRLDIDVEYLWDGARVEEESAPGSLKESEEVDKNLKLKFYQIGVRIVFSDGDEEQEQSGSFIVQTYTAARANLLIEKWLRDEEERRYRQALDNPDRSYTPRQVNSFIEESKTIPVGTFIPEEFSLAYHDEKDSADA
jgi:hypothetical protein